MRRRFLAWSCAVIAVAGCKAPPAPASPPAPGPPTLAPVAASTPTGERTTLPLEDVPEGKLVAAQPRGVAADSNATVTVLSDDATAALLARLEPLPAVPGGAPPLRSPSAPPPRTGRVEPIAFVTPIGKPAGAMPARPTDAKRALPAPQILPIGEVTAEAEIRVRFAEPMVAVAQVGAGKVPPITITPPVAGTWRWLDTRVLAFTARGPRLAMATEYTVTVPAGVRAVSGATLAEATTGTFSTPPPSIVDRFPRVVRPDSAIAIRFDQDIDPAKIATFLGVTHGKKSLPLRTVTLDEAKQLWARNPSLQGDVDAQLGPHHVIIAPVDRWPADAEIQVTMRAGVPSREGPRVTGRGDYTTVRIVPAFTVRGIECDDAPKPRMTARCSARSRMHVEVSNPIEPKAFRAGKFQITGAPFQDTTAQGTRVGLWVPKTVGSRHAIRVGDDLVDIYGQPLVGARDLAFTVTAERWWSWLWAETGMFVLDPRFAIPQWTVDTHAVQAVRIELYQVQPADYFAYRRFELGARSTPPGTRVYKKTHTVGADYSTHVRVDLRPALTPVGTGHVVAIAEVTPVPGKIVDRRRAVAWIQVSKIGMTARIDGDKLSAWVSDIAPDRFLAATPSASAQLYVEDRGTRPVASGTSAADGHVAFELPAPAPKKAAKSGDAEYVDDDGDGMNDHVDAMLLATAGADSVFTVVDRREKAIRHAYAAWYVTDDRFVYKPGEKVFVKGWVRWTHDGVNPDLALPAANETVAYTLVDARGVKVASGAAPLSAHGGFDLEVALPPTVNLGRGTFTFETREQTRSHPIEIQEFETPAFAVALDDDVTHKGATPLVAGEQIEMSVEATYYAGGGLPGADVRWAATLSSARYTPPGWDPFRFTPPVRRSDRGAWRHVVDHGRIERTDTGELSGASTAGVVYGIPATPGGVPALLSVDATVADVDRTRIRASSRPILVHPSAYYVGLRLAPDTTDRVEAIVTDIDGAPVRGVKIDVEVEGVLGSERWRDDAAIIDTHRCTLTSGEAPVVCAFPRKDWKTAYTATATIADRRERPNRAQLELPWWGHDDTREVSIIPDRPSYKPGDVAKLEIRSKTVPATAVVTFARNGIVREQRVELAAASTTIELPIEPAYVSNVHVQVDRIARRRYVRTPDPRPLPELASAEVDLPVDIESARLVMTTRPRQALIEPGEPATFDVEVKHAGVPVAGAEVALIVVDEAVLSLSEKQHRDPLQPFYRRLSADTSHAQSFDLVRDAGEALDGTPGVDRVQLGLHGTGSGYGVGNGRGGMRGRTASAPSIRIGTATVESRKDFRPNAVFSPRLTTDAQGRTSVTVRMPDNLTRYKVIALATANTRLFGKADSVIVAQKKLNARTAAPRFLSQGDTFSLPVVVQNLDRAPRTIDVAVRAANLASTGPAGKRVTVPGGQRAEVRFELATRARGKAVIQTIVASGAAADASTVEVPVYEPATTESFATYGVVDDAPAFEQLVLPGDIFKDVGGVEVEVTSTQLSSLTDAYWYLYAYPYECAEQRSGRMLATAALTDILDAFASGGRPDKATIAAQIAKDVKLLERSQNVDGGWGYFRGMDSDPFVTQQVLAALLAHKAAGRVVKDATAYVTKQATTLLAGLEASAKLPGEKRRDRDTFTYRVGLAAAALATLATTTDVRPRALRLHATATTLGAYPIDAQAHVLAILAKHAPAKQVRAELVPKLVSRIHETARGATVAASFAPAERMLLVSNTKTSALVLDALIREAPEHTLITKLARGVLDSRRHGRWVSTQENLAALAAMRRYFDTYEKDTPSFTGKLWVGATGYAEQAFAGRSTARGQARLGWSELPTAPAHDLALVKEGTGRMYYRVGITYAPQRTDLPALDAGFLVRRTYTAVDDPADVTTLPDGRVRVRLGARVLVTVDTLNTTDRFGVAVVDPLPAGFESVNVALATSERAVVVEEARWQYRNMRDNRSEVFAMNLPAGTHRFAYTVRAATPGTFVAAPAKAEEMYSPETFGRSTGTTVVIE